MIEFTDHPILTPPTDEEIVFLGENHPHMLKDLHEAHEGRIQASEQDPVRHGFNLDGWERIKDGLGTYNECLCLGGNRSGKTTGLHPVRSAGVHRQSLLERY